MKTNIKFKKMYYKLPQEARSRLVLDFVTDPKTLQVCWIEIKNGTEEGKKILKQLGYIDK